MIAGAGRLYELLHPMHISAQGFEARAGEAGRSANGKMNPDQGNLCRHSEIKTSVRYAGRDA